MKAATKRFYDKVAVRALSAAEGFAVTLDGRELRTPAMKMLALPTEDSHHHSSSTPSAAAVACCGHHCSMPVSALPGDIPLGNIPIGALSRRAFSWW